MENNRNHADMEFRREFGKFIQLDWETGCWLWNGPRQNPFGHRQFMWRLNGTRIAHRIAWQLYIGPISKGMCVLHKCDVPNCINPKHLFLGTQADNINDMHEKGRAHRSQKQTHCVNGHPFNEKNTFKKENGTQGCKRCRSDAQLRYKAKNLEYVRKYQRERAMKLRMEAI